MLPIPPISLKPKAQELGNLLKLLVTAVDFVKRKEKKRKEKKRKEKGIENQRRNLTAKLANLILPPIVYRLGHVLKCKIGFTLKAADSTSYLVEVEYRRYLTPRALPFDSFSHKTSHKTRHGYTSKTQCPLFSHSTRP